MYAHELAHAMGLAHAQTTTQVMYPSVGAQAWGAGDAAGFATFASPSAC